MVFLSSTLILLLLLATSLYFWIRQKQRYWPKRGVAYDSSFLFYFGGSELICFLTQRVYERFKNSGNLFVGIQFLFRPTALMIDLDLLRTILITNFDNFPDRGLYHNVRDDPLSGSIVRLGGEPWKRLRTKLTPTFTAAKMRNMTGTVVQVGERLVNLFNEEVEPKGTELEICDVCARYTTDVIGLVGFGIECDSLKEPNSEFRLMGDQAINSIKPLRSFLDMAFPRLAKFLKVRVYPQELIEFYTRIVTKNVEKRETRNIRRKDFLDILIELKNSQADNEFKLTLTEIIGQSFVFFVAGFETSSSTMSFCLFEMSQNQEIQQRARNEVLDCLERHNNQLSYECLSDMQYLKQVVSETLRKYPVVSILKRVTRKRFVVPQTQQVLENGVNIIVSIYAIHHDPQIYPNPSVFDPERFSDEAVRARHPMAYLPFGAGPRICIAERFGRMQIMIGVAMLLRHFRFDCSNRTPKTLDFDKISAILSVPGGIPLKVTPI